MGAVNGYKDVAAGAMAQCIPQKMSKYVRVTYGEQVVRGADGALWLPAAVKSPLGSLRCRVRVAGGQVAVELQPSAG